MILPWKQKPTYPVRYYVQAHRLRYCSWHEGICSARASAEQVCRSKAILAPVVIWDTDLEAVIAVVVDDANGLRYIPIE